MIGDPKIHPERLALPSWRVRIVWPRFPRFSNHRMIRRHW